MEPAEHPEDPADGMGSLLGDVIHLVEHRLLAVGPPLPLPEAREEEALHNLVHRKPHGGLHLLEGKGPGVARQGVEDEVPGLPDELPIVRERPV